MFKTLSLRSVSQYLVDPLLLVVAFFTSFMILPLVAMPYDNPFNISNSYSGTGFNPSNNYIQIVFLIAATVGIFYGLRRLYSSKYVWVIKLLVALLIIGNHFLTVIIPNGNISVIDSFHTGEQLSPARAWLSGDDHLYQDAFYLRGAGMDTLIAATGFKLFGISIGSYLITLQFLILVALASFLSLVAKLIRNPLIYLVTVTLFYLSASTSLVELRDTPIWLSLGLLFYVFSPTNNQKARYAALAGIGLIASLSLFMAVDRGMLLIALTGLLMGVLPLFQRTNKNEYKRVTLQQWQRQLLAPAFIAGGLAIGLIVPALLMGWPSFNAFLQLSFHEIPAYAGLLVSQPIPPLFGEFYLYYAPVFIAITTGMVLVHLLRSKKVPLNILLPLGIIFIFGILCLKGGANRIDVAKMATTTAPLYLASVLILGYAVKLIHKEKLLRASLVPLLIISVIIVIFFGQFKPERLIHQFTYTRADLSHYRHMTSRPDDAWIAAETREVRDYIINHTNKTDTIFAFTSNPLYYYLTDRSNPSRFYISWYADPQPLTNELLRDLKANKPKLIIYKEDSWMDSPDNQPMSSRIPDVDRWIKETYKKSTKIGTTEILHAE